MEYIIFAVIVYALFLLENKKSSTMKDVKNLKYGKRQSRISIVAIVLMILFAGLRNYTIGYDLPNYKKNFDLIYNNNDLKGHSFEKCFQVLNYCCSKIFGNIYGFNAMLLVIATIEVLCVVYVARNISSDISLTMFLYIAIGVFFRSFGQVRQGVAVALLMCATLNIIRKCPLKFVCFVLLATLFHKSAIIFAFMYILTFSNSKTFNIVYIAILSGVVTLFALFGNDLVKIICDLFSLDYYDKYIATNYGKASLTTVGILEIVAVTLVSIFFIVYTLYKKHKGYKFSLDYEVFKNLFLCSTAFYYISAISGTALTYERYIFYFFWALIFLIPAFLNSIASQNTKNKLRISCIIVGILFLYASIMIIDAYGIYPYITFLS